ncbi:pentapeptide repeat-containing protein [Halococcus dombrowskii]|uniref:Pentapeptide repeat-containing protein n=2 Tax=Halococcus dombrowskii TaxID=179637 RepID=A0AAX3AJ39_HALDO|nr:pentapeptide repeat-containing protein [Halococcus dombrowskii]UOO94102.1 pentapeptide repeat-containing protein [Halococcus dombrowskii]
MSQSANRCGYTWPEDHDVNDTPDRQSCCYRPSLSDRNRCIWHSNCDETEDWSRDILKSSRAPKEIQEKNGKISELLDGVSLPEFNGNYSISFSQASCRDSNFKGSDLGFFDFSGSDLRGSDFTSTSLEGADFSESDLRDVDFSRSHFSETSFHKSDLRGAKMPGNEDEFDGIPLYADFTGADLRGVTFPFDLQFSEMSKAFFIPEPLDFDPSLGVPNSDEVRSEFGQSSYFGPPTDDPGRKVCMEAWPNMRIVCV